jgi:hypothetical protein
VSEVARIGAERDGCRACRSCGAKLAIRKRLFCDQCLHDRREEAERSTDASFRAAGPTTIAAARRRSRSHNHAQGAAPPSKHCLKQRKVVAAWRDDGPLDRVHSRRDILPKRQSLTGRVIAKAMDCSVSRGSRLRSGSLPH